jgi:ubiquinone/menaquinone biosynthesis C-methylase UbiE
MFYGERDKVKPVEKSEIVKKARDGFNKDLLNENYYRIHSDEEHLKALIESLDVKSQGKYLDLGTGNGYIAFELAGISQDIQVYGLDIAGMVIARNRGKALKKSLGNIYFDTYDGIRIPYQDNFFDGIISRYAIHHFPDIRLTVDRISRILRPDGIVVIADPTVDSSDKQRFIDSFMQLKDDGHVRFYFRDELEDLFRQYRLQKERVFYSSIRFPRMTDERYYSLLNSVPEDIPRLYDTKIDGEHILVTLTVMNLIFRKRKGTIAI